MTWEYETFGPDGQCKLFGINIFDYDWKTTVCHVAYITPPDKVRKQS